jgi:hypothetical protein
MANKLKSLSNSKSTVLIVDEIEKYIKWIIKIINIIFLLELEGLECHH